MKVKFCFNDETKKADLSILPKYEDLIDTAAVRATVVPYE